MKNIVLVLSMGMLLSMGAKDVCAQGMAVNSTGAAADASAVFDASSTSQGMLIPRMTNAQKTAIASPATGLLVYQTDGTAGFYFYNGSSWVSLNSGLSNVTTQGNTFNGASQLVQLDGSGNMPAVNGSALTSLSASNLGSGTVPTARMGSGVANSTTFLRGDNTWATPSGGSGTVTSVSSGVLTSGTTAFTDTIFRTSVSLSTTTPTINYSFTNANAYTVLTNSTNAPSVPVYGKVKPLALYDNGSGSSASSSTFYRGDGAWQSISSGGSYMFLENTAGTVGNASLTYYSNLSGSQASTTNPYPLNATNTNCHVMSSAFTADALTIHGYCRALGATPAGVTITVELYDNGASTGVSATCTIPSAVGDGTTGTWSGTYSVASGHYLYYVITISATGNNAPALWISLHGH